MSNTVQAPTSEIASGPRVPARGWVVRVGYSLLGQTGARVGLAWVITMVLMAVFAPFIANSHPYWWWHEGELEFPLFRHLHWRDTGLLIGFFSAVSLFWLRRVPVGVRVGGWLAILMLSTAGRVSLPLYQWFAASLDGDDATSIEMRVAAGVLLLLLLAAGVGTIWTLMRPRVSRFSVVTLTIGVLLGGVMAVLPQSPDAASVVYDSYREALASGADGQAEGAVFAPIAYSPSDFQRDDAANAMLQNPSWAHPMGTSEKGADVASRMIHATRVALVIGLIATGISLILGVIVGGLMGYFSGWVDLLGMRLVEVFSAIPVIFILIMICAVYDRNIYLMMTVIGLTGWVGYAIFIRAEFLRLRKMDYVQAAQALGTPLHGILFRHLLPNGVAPVLVLASFGFASAILMESSLSFLGLGLPPQDPSWGQLLQEARNNGGAQWWLVFYPGLAIFLTVFAYNLIGEALRDALDPRAAK